MNLHDVRWKGQENELSDKVTSTLSPLILYVLTQKKWKEWWNCSLLKPSVLSAIRDNHSELFVYILSRRYYGTKAEYKRKVSICTLPCFLFSVCRLLDLRRKILKVKEKRFIFINTKTQIHKKLHRWTLTPRLQTRKTGEKRILLLSAFQTLIIDLLEDAKKLMSTTNSSRNHTQTHDQNLHHNLAIPISTHASRIYLPIYSISYCYCLRPHENLQIYMIYLHIWLMRLDEIIAAKDHRKPYMKANEEKNKAR